MGSPGTAGADGANDHVEPERARLTDIDDATEPVKKAGDHWGMTDRLGVADRINASSRAEAMHPLDGQHEPPGAPYEAAL